MNNKKTNMTKVNKLHSSKDKEKWSEETDAIKGYKTKL